MASIEFDASPFGVIVGDAGSLEFRGFAAVMHRVEPPHEVLTHHLELHPGHTATLLEHHQWRFSTEWSPLDGFHWVVSIGYPWRSVGTLSSVSV